jgi:hypothetical protein
MRFTQSQVRDLLSISVDDFRTWRGAVPALADHKGHAPSFTPGDVIALAIIAQLVRDFGVRVGTMSAQLETLVQICRGRSWVSLEACLVLIDSRQAQLFEGDAASLQSFDTSTAIIPCAPIVERLRWTLTTHEIDRPQGHLQFPPMGIQARSDRRLKRA